MTPYPPSYQTGFLVDEQYTSLKLSMEEIIWNFSYHTTLVSKRSEPINDIYFHFVIKPMHELLIGLYICTWGAHLRAESLKNSTQYWDYWNDWSLV